MEENKDLVTEEVAENAGQTAEEDLQKEEPPQAEPKTYTQEEVDEIVGKAKARAKAKVTREYESKYGRLGEVLKAGTGGKDIPEITDAFEKYYEGKGLKIRKDPEYSTKDVETLAKSDAEEIIKLGDDEVVEEINRLTELGTAKMSAREKAAFPILVNYNREAERNRELAEIGVTKDVYNSPEFKAFQSQFVSGTPMKTIYELYTKTQPKKEIKTIGSMKSTKATDDNGVKDFYSFEEASKFTKADFDKNPALFKSVQASIPKWKK